MGPPAVAAGTCVDEQMGSGAWSRKSHGAQAVLTGGSTAGTVGGAVVGGVIGNQVDKDKKK